MRTGWWGCIVAGVLMTCWGAYQHVSQPSLQVGLLETSLRAERSAAQTGEQPVAAKEEARLQQADAAPLRSKPDQLPHPRKDARLENAADAGSVEHAERSGRDALHQTPEQPVADTKNALLQAAPIGPEAHQFPKEHKKARLEDAAGTDAVQRSEPSDTKGTLSYLAWYVFSEIPPETKPADTVLNALKDIPTGTPVEEIRRVADLLGIDFTFMKAIAKIESGFDPTQRTGSYIGLFQLSRYEFKKYGSGDILVARDNAVAAGLKMITEAELFQVFTRRKTTLFDLYLIHQQGIEGAAEHLSQPNRLAWRSMCKTQEGKEKGERWCKLAIWGNTLPALKRTWKSVNKVTSRDFVAMWQQRVSHFYARYSQAAMAH